MSWPMVPFGEILKLAPRELAKNQRLPIMSITMKDGLIDQDEKFKKRIASADSSTYKVVHRGNLVVGFPIDEGVLGFQHKYAAAAVSPAYDIWEATGQHDLDRDFFEKILRSPMARAIYASKMRGTTNRRRTIPKDIFKKILFPLPPLPEQKRIAAILDAADALRAKRRESLEQLDQLLQSTFLEMFGDPVTNPKGWDTSSLLQVAELENGDRSSNYPSGTDVIEEGVLFLSTKNIVANRLVFEECQFITQEKFDSLSRGKLRRHDIVITLRGTLGSCAIFDCNFDTGFINAQLMIIRPREVEPRYLHGLLSSLPMQDYFSRSSTGVAVKQLTGKQIGALSIPIPPLDLQQRFATIVESIEQQKARCRAQLDEIDTLFASLQSRAFNGEL